MGEEFILTGNPDEVIELYDQITENDGWTNISIFYRLALAVDAVSNVRKNLLYLENHPPMADETEDIASILLSF
jgi:hypothetical protein